MGLYSQRHITNCSRVIRQWHFCYASGLAVKVVCRGFGMACLTP
ncbi:DUF3265 domain-containing protein [Vibrio parahaemolyticus]|nr:DUF3265 domain-containing protein [Vibrio parahaemolyticus]EJG0875470.1 DUF3265 domain-containing protein [Vibrio parahaemolyticus O3]EJG0904100.1 DUF3265 domain-containing protein [Vibrio parahaemolyticus O3:K56]EJG1076929.1 DUF3265 domain-containing protein [Vibrio parahaemolyticus O1:K56]EGR5853414.1 DUF3265 domain-containing protein [Vibrio parahaemolyticus]